MTAVVRVVAVFGGKKCLFFLEVEVRRSSPGE
jgi:hypothetical protein